MIKTEEVQKGLSRETIIEKMSEQFTVMEEVSAEEPESCHVPYWFNRGRWKPSL